MKRELRPHLLIPLLAPLAYWVLSWNATTAALLHHAEEVARDARAGVAWEFSQASSVVRGSLDTFARWHRGDDGLRLVRGDEDAFVSLNFAGRRLPASRFHTLQLSYSAPEAGRLRLFHRSRLDGPILTTPPVPLAAGQHTLEIDLAQRPWTTLGAQHDATIATPSLWGHAQGQVASLRIHPLEAPGELTLHAFRLLPDPALQAVSTVAIPTWQGWPERSLAQWESWRFAAPRPEPNWHLPLSPWLLWLIGALVLLANLWLRRPALVVAGVVLVLLAPLVDERWSSSLLWASLPLGLGTAYWLAWRYTDAPIYWGRGWISAAAICAIAIIIAVGLLGAQVDWIRGARYLPWAFIQQSFLLLFLLPMIRAARWPAPAVLAALLFGLLHYPNFMLMCATLLLGLLSCWHFWRHRNLAATTAIHAALGTLFLHALPEWILRGGEVGNAWFY